MSTDAIRYLVFDTALGPAAVAGGSRGVRGVVLPGLARKALVREVRRRFPGAMESARGLAGTAAAIRNYFETGRLGRRRAKLDLGEVTGLRRKVYDALAEVPRGETITYGELARRVGHPGAHRSVGSAVARNPVPLLIPCHRAVRSDGGLGGYTAEGGTDLKRWMLEIEGARPCTEC
jgi:methylated-DNA-[protein]-cysteine S-methyltransferase